MGTLLLTSTGLSSPNVLNKFLEIIDGTKNKQVAIVTTAAEGKRLINILSWPTNSLWA